MYPKKSVDSGPPGVRLDKDSRPMRVFAASKQFHRIRRVFSPTFGKVGTFERQLPSTFFHNEFRMQGLLAPLNKQLNVKMADPYARLLGKFLRMIS